jgi:hypothetical protein
MKSLHLKKRKFNRRNFLKTWGIAMGGLIYVPGKYLAQGQPTLTGAFTAGGAFSISTTASPVNFITSGLLARYGCQEGSGSTLNDSSGNGYNATFQKGAPSWTTGHNGGYAVLNTASNYAQTANVSWETQNGAASSQCAWVYPTSFASQLVVSSYGEVVDENFTSALGISPAGYVSFMGDGNYNPGQSTLAVPLNKWSFIGWTQAGPSNAPLIFYLNAAFQTSSVTADWPVTSPQPLLIGCTAQDTVLYDYWVGAFQDVRFYSRQLSSAEMLSIYNGTG